MLVGAVMGRGPFYYVTIGAVVCVLALSASTSVADFPRLCRVLSRIASSPTRSPCAGGFVFTQGILALSVLSAALLVAFGGITDRLIPLLHDRGLPRLHHHARAGMEQHWRRIGGPEARHSLPINAVGAVGTGLTLVVVAVSKFTEGAWLTLLVIPLLMYAFVRVNRHYRSVAAQIVTAEPARPRRAGAPSPWWPCGRGTSSPCAGSSSRCGSRRRCTRCR